MPRQSNFLLGLNDMLRGLMSVHVWSYLGWQEIKQRYRRSTLGPFWLTISTGVLVGAMGPLYGRLFGQQAEGYMIYFAVGFVAWQLMAAIVNDATSVFTSSEAYIKQIKLPFTLHVMRMVWKNAIIFAHNLVIVFLVLIVYLPSWKWSMLLAIIGVFAILINAVWIGIFLGLVGARFRDIQQVILNIVTLAFFLTPIMWTSAMLGNNQWAAQVNPFFHFLEIVRAPLIGALPAGHSYLIVILVTIVGFAMSLALFSRYRSRIAYWV